MQFVNNEPEQIEIRKSQNTLIVVGTGTIIFSIWTMVKILSTLFLLRKETVAAMKENFDNLKDISDVAVFWVMAGIAFLCMAVWVAVRTYVGLSAIAEGRGKRKSLIYLLLAGVMIILSAWSFVAGFFNEDAPVELGAFTRNQSISALIIEMTSMIMMIQLVASALRIRKLMRTDDHAGD